MEEDAKKAESSEPAAAPAEPAAPAAPAAEPTAESAESITMPLVEEEPKKLVGSLHVGGEIAGGRDGGW